MAGGTDLLIGEFVRSFDDRHRLAIPPELASPLLAGGRKCALAKERQGCLSIWTQSEWKLQVESAVDVLRAKWKAGLLVQRSSQVQDVGRLLSTRHRWVSLAGRGRLVVPEGFREFLGVEPGGTVIVVGAAVCIELWQPSAWHAFITAEMPQFRQQLGELIG